MDDDEEFPAELAEKMEENEGLKAVYKKQWNKIKDFINKGKVRDTYNLQILSLDPEYLSKMVIGVFEKQSTAFKINAAFGFVLRHNETGELKYHYTSNNSRVLSAPMLVQNGQTSWNF